jgi:uncharacterized protein YciI
VPRGENIENVVPVYRAVINHRHLAGILADQSGNGGRASSLVCARALPAEGRPVMLFAVTRHDKPNSLDLRLSERPRHLVYLATVLDKIMYGGALLDDAGRQIGSILMIDVADQAEADAFAVADPYVDAGLFASTSIRQFRRVFTDGAWL